MTFPIGLACLLWALALASALWGTWFALRRFARNVPPPADKDLPPISILKPLKGCERGIEENLKSFFELDYPKFELLFSVAESRDPVVEVAKKLIARFPSVPARLLIGSVDISPNPKVNNMMVAYEQAEHDCLLISDSNVRVARDYLRKMIGSLTDGVGVVTAVVAGRWAQGLGGHLEAAYLNTFYARWMQAAEAFRQAYVLGKSMLFRRSVADRFGGLRHLGQYIAEDYMLGEAMRRLGLRVTVMADPISQFIGDYSLSMFWQRHLRWGRIRKTTVPALFILEPFSGLFFSGFCGAWALHAWLGISMGFTFCVHAALWTVADLLLIHRLEGGTTWKSVASWLLREVLALPHWVHMAVGNSILWRGSRLRLLPGGLLESRVEPFYCTETNPCETGLVAE